MNTCGQLKKYIAVAIASLAITLGGVQVSNASSITVTWDNSGGDLIYSINGSWSSWDAPTPSLISTDTLKFEANGNTTFAFDLSRGNLSGNNAQNVIMDVRSGLGSVTGPDFAFGAPLPTTGYNLIHLNEGGFLVLEAEVASGATFTIDESINLGSGYTLTAGTRMFSSSTATGDTLTMEYITSNTPAPVPLPASALLLATGFGALGFMRRRPKKTA